MSSWDERWDAEDERRRYDDHYCEPDTVQRGWLGQMSTMDNVMHTETFKVVETWARKYLGVAGLRGFIGASTLLVPVGVYTFEKLNWLNENLTNSIQIDSRLQQAKKLQQWVNKQPESSMFSWLPTFEKLELNKDTSDDFNEQTGSATNAALMTSRSQMFVFQGKFFILNKANTSRYHDALNIRCLWGSTKPIFALLAAVTASETLKEEAPLMVTTVWHDNTERDETVKRPLSLIDMEPDQKKWLLNDLKKFFAKDSISYYRTNGTPYRRGYLLYGPPGTGKTSLAQAIASDYDLELFEVKLAKMKDSMLQRTFKELPSRCVVLFEDIDAAGIGREDLIKAEATSKESMKESETGDTRNDWGAYASGEDYEADPEAYCRNHDIEIPPEQSFVTLSGLLNTLDGPGAREGRFVIMTTNSPKTLDKAITRKGRMDKLMYLGYSSPASAACTFKRMFGTDLTFRVPPNELDRLAKRFARKIPKDMFTPCEISDYCREHRGEPREAIKQFRKFMEDRIAGKGEFLYDIKDNAQESDARGVYGKDGGVNSKHTVLPPEDPDTDSEGEDEAYSSLGDSAVSQAPTPLRVAGSPDGQSTASEENTTETLQDTLRANGEVDWMFENGHYLPDWAFIGWW